MSNSQKIAAPALSVVRSDNGFATFTYTYDGEPKTATGFWDDATPWESGSYAMDFAVKSNTGKDSFRLENVYSRTGILIHNGTSVNWTEGCLIVSQSFIDSIYNDLKAHNIDTTVNTVSPLTVNVSGDFDVHLNLTTTSEVKEGDPITATISLTGPGAANGLSKDVYVKLASTGGTAIEGVNYDNLQAIPGSVSLNGVPGWIKLAAGSTSTTISIPTNATSASQSATLSSKIAQFKISDYKIQNNVKAGAIFYHDEANILSVGANISAATQIDSLSTVIGSAVNASGGNEGYDTTNQFAPGQTLDLFFDPYTIPDRFEISTDTGSVLVDTGFIGGRTYSNHLVVPTTGDGKLRIQVLTNDPGTAWTFTITPATSTPKQNTLSNVSYVAAPVVSTAPITVKQNTNTILVNSDEIVGASFAVVLNDAALTGRTISWRLVPSGTTPGAISDFPSNVPLSGKFTIASDAKIGSLIFQYELPTPNQVIQSNGIDTFDIQFFEADGTTPIRNSSGSVIRINIDVIGQSSITSPLIGSVGDDVLNGTSQADVIVGQIGSDMITGDGGDDYIDGGVGNDTIMGGDGNDKIVPGFGADVIDGGEGDDTVLLPRNRSDVTLVTDSHNKTVISDTSLAPLGDKALTNVEHVRFIDQVVDLASNSPANVVVTNTIWGDATFSSGEVYNGPVSGIDFQYINISPDNVNILANRSNMFVRSGDGMDAIAAHDGTNVLDGGGGSNFLAGGAGQDTFFVDDRNPSADIWSTISNFQAGDAVTVWGITPTDFSLIWANDEGAAGYTGLTLHALADGRPTASLTLTGYTQLDLSNGRLSLSFGIVGDSTYLYIHGNR
ncbi:calcium-binding protein [Azospirillum sp. B4]|uniref:calcium-binding protein n=1 Tax=Azospirillum sp. B4 TaxID=95605 RepID=UPI0003467F56|nr:calcium-binding protein [Azospirillum sp. B4]